MYRGDHVLKQDGPPGALPYTYLEPAQSPFIQIDNSFIVRMLEMKSANETVDFMRRCPFEFANEYCEMVLEGQRVSLDNNSNG